MSGRRNTTVNRSLDLWLPRGGQREEALVEHGCNYFGKNTIRSAPFAPFLRQDLLQLALDLKVPIPEIYGTITVENFVYMKQLALLSPETKVFSNMEPTMIYYDPAQSGVNITIGKDALYYHQNCPGLMWNQDEQPYGFAGVRRLFEALKECI